MPNDIEQFLPIRITTLMISALVPFSADGALPDLQLLSSLAGTARIYPWGRERAPAFWEHRRPRITLHHDEHN